MNQRNRNRKIAALLLAVLLTELITPTVAWALTSGPAQPEMAGFKPVGMTEMVDLTTGDFEYNIPLLDIDGYPINIDYQSGTGIDDEAGWVGLGWNLTPGAINRQVRGLPDDFAGDTASTTHYIKPKVTVGGRLTAKVETRGKAKVNGSFTIGLFNDNYTGIGAELGVNAGISFSLANDGMLTAGLGAGVLSNTQSGVDFTPYVNLSVREKATTTMTVNAGLSASLGYNTRSGLKALTLSSSYGLSATRYDLKVDVGVGIASVTVTEKSGAASFSAGGASISYNTEPIMPAAQTNYKTTYDSFSLDVGGTIFPVFIGAGGTGYQNVRQVKDILQHKPAYGFLYAERGKNNKDALMDFVREKDNPIVPNLPNLALPIHTPDLWSYTSQAGSGQFRLYRAGTGIFFDNETADESHVSSTGADVGLGFLFHGGITHYDQNTTNVNRKWHTNNSYLSKGDFQDENTKDPRSQHVFFKQVGEKNLQDPIVQEKLLGEEPLQVYIGGKTAGASFLRPNNLYSSVSQPITRTNGHRLARTTISHLTAKEAALGGLDKSIAQYKLYTPVDTLLPNYLLPDSSKSRRNSVRKDHHISEITVTQDDGKRMVYGIPVYNLMQEEYTFAVDTMTTAKQPRYYPKRTNNVPTPATVLNPTVGNLGLDNYFHKERKTGHATSFLLTAILSPDYMDRTGNGISPDDLGTAVKFNYGKLPYKYKWRSPYSGATLNKCMMADADDDKASIVYGEKEVWYISSIETKSKVAYFITEDRRDGLGALNWNNGGIDANNKLKRLKEIRLYSKSDMTRPLKVVKFEYTYELCRNIPNSADLNSTDTLKGGKLTLKKIWFQYGNSDKGKFHPYQFQYNKTDAANTKPGYSYLSTDRWGVYKNQDENGNGLDNEQYPYSNQNAPAASKNTALWHLNRIDLPTGGTIEVDYEAKDYAYVQDKKAMRMGAVTALISAPGQIIDSAQLNRAKGIRLMLDSLPPPGTRDVTAWFKRAYLNESDYLYTKFMVKLSTNNSYSAGADNDFVPCYAQVRSVSKVNGQNAVDVIFTDVVESKVAANPISIAAWQKIRSEYPRYAYPGYDNRVRSANSSIIAAVTALANAAKNLSELRVNFYEKANKSGYGSVVSLKKSFVKLAVTKGKKIGGGARVKRISITDAWNQMTNSKAVTARYGQQYDYTTTDGGQIISSGVAAYEPAIGNDENALKQPVPYMHQVKGGITNYLQLERPFGESLYPAPTIVYSKVTVRDLNKDYQASNVNGQTVNEYFTARDFPVIVKVLPIVTLPNRPASLYSMLASNSVEELCMSQGYSIETNDMHGRAKKVSVYNQTGALVNSTEYQYLQQNDHQLDNKVSVIGSDGKLQPNQVIGEDVEFFTDFREQETINNGRNINLGVDMIPLFIGTFPLPHFPINANNDYKLFRSACAVKSIQRFGILKQVIKTQNGASITTENLAFDGLTGEALITRTQNEFNNNIYSTTIPAYWAYKNMGGAYQTAGILASDLKTNADGVITSSAYSFYLTEGDELLNLSNGQRYWVTQGLSAGSKQLIERSGKTVENLNSSGAAQFVKIVRSGYRNQLGDGLTSVVSLDNPLEVLNNNQYLRMRKAADLSTLKVINAAATTYHNVWAKTPRSSSNDTTIVNGPVEDFTFTAGGTHIGHAMNGVVSVDEFNPVTQNYVIFSRAALQARFDAASIWLNPISKNIEKPIGLEYDFYISQSYDYYIGYSADDDFTYAIDNVTLNNPYAGQLNTASAPYYWFVKKLHLDIGWHHLSMVGKNLYLPSGNPNPGALSLDIYKNTLSDLKGNTSLNVVFSTSSLRGNQYLQSFYSSDNAGINRTYHYLHRSFINPYVEGYYGNWRPEKTMAFQGTRFHNDIFGATNKEIKVKEAGYINQFYSYWFIDSLTGRWSENIPTSENNRKWVTANTITLYDRNGQQIENRDALNRYSAAKFDFNWELPGAVASNAMKREIFATSFEEFYFYPGVDYTTAEFTNYFEELDATPGLVNFIDTKFAHTGNNSVLLPDSGLTILSTVHSKNISRDSLLTRNDKGEYNTLKGNGKYPRGFEPVTGKKYIISLWVNDGQPQNRNIKIQVKLNGTNVNGLTCRAVVEGWKLIEGTITMPYTEQSIKIRFQKTSGAVYVDDFRIHPYNSQMKTYTYDDKTLRLMAELDENGFATFYEYDDEGLLVRVKKETEKGIMTLKESRSSYKKTGL